MENRTSFGLHADAYRAFRPEYPDSLYGWLAGLCERHDAALDCATGSGQAACGLVRHFRRVVATDTDPAQIAEALRNERIEYVVAPAEALTPALGTFDLVTVAQGAHWFDLPVFYSRLEALLAPGAVVAIWGYSHCRIAPDIDAAVQECLNTAIDPYWAEGNRIIMDHYRTIPFPYDEIEAPAFTMVVNWTPEAFFGFARTLSAYKRLRATAAPDPLERLAARLESDRLWPRERQLSVAFDLHMRIGRVRAS
jgi:SAM-dependent methyltransferase